MEIKIKYLNKELDFTSKKEYINENILIPYGELAAEEAFTPISMSDSSMLMDLESEMCLKILNTWEVNKYNLDAKQILNENILLDQEKFIYKMLLGKILRLIPGGVTIISIGINNSIARRFTQALGYAVSELCSSYINLAINEKYVEIVDVFTKEAVEDLMESYLIEYNKTVLN
ncbi:hypothetical protein [Terrisporobacter glycolicus]|uniref:Uncharacterized protein n=1 Tax=Terrisporobacter glycolicus ATCC 14880 = DSM 1288 TaxID=1121315 RepID=A0ABZ2EZD0_9FIRM|nr:hypothetical protein [Terrisporobacter glycolicus]